MILMARRQEYMVSLEQASVKEDDEAFVRFIGNLTGRAMLHYKFFAV